MNNKDWRQIVRVDGHAVEALEKLAELVTGNKVAFRGTDTEFVQKCEFITAVPIEIALNMSDRATLKRRSPDTRWIITGVTAHDVENMVNCYGYNLTVGIKAKPQVAKPVTSTLKLKYSVNGKTVESEIDCKSADVNEQISAFFSAAQKLS